MRKMTILTLLLVLVGLSSWAQDEAKQDPMIVIWLNDGNKTEVLFDEMPVFSFDNGVMTLKGETTEMSWPLEKLDKFTFGYLATGIRDVKTTDLDILSDQMAVYDLNGRLIRQNIKSLSELPKGVYIIKNGRVTTKVVRK